MGSGIDPELMRRVREGDYIVDPHAVAEAILRRGAARAEARRISEMLVAGEVDGRSVGGDEPGSRPDGD